MNDVVLKLISLNKTISTMESCTGGAVVDAITNVEGASTVLKFSAITYSNEFKVKMGVCQETIDKYSVYSIQTAQEMSKCISDFTESDYGVGVTGKLNKYDPNNLVGDDNTVFISIYDKVNSKYYNESVHLVQQDRAKNKLAIVDKISMMLVDILK